jgi:hypothetical protein
MKKRGVMDAIRDLNDCGLKTKMRKAMPAEEMAMIALRPFMEVIGGRIALMLEAAMEAGERAPQWQSMESAPDYAIFWLEADLDNINNDASGIRPHMRLCTRQLIPALLKPVKWYPAPSEPKGDSV